MQTDAAFCGIDPKTLSQVCVRCIGAQEDELLLSLQCDDVHLCRRDASIGGLQAVFIVSLKKTISKPFNHGTGSDWA
jgi:hypothetical protein